MSGESGSVRRSVAQRRPRRLLLCLDGVPFDLIEQAKGRGLFDFFGTPSRLWSPFPTLTNVGLAAMLGASPPPGYEGLYFDRQSRAFGGGIWKYVGRRTPDKIPSSYMDELDYQEPLHFEFLIYFAAERIWRADFKGFREAFHAAPRTRDFFGFIKATDGLLHLYGPAHLNVALESLDRILREIHDYCGRETEIVLFSDHGMVLQELRRIHLRTHVEKCGYQFVHSLTGRKGRALAVPGFGLCGYAAVYCGAETEVSAVGDALAELEGVDFAIYCDSPETVVVNGQRGKARIHRQENAQASPTNFSLSSTRSLSELYRYEQLGGDPLQLGSIVQNLKAKGELDAFGYASDAAWFAATDAHVYPDALANLYHALHKPRVRNTADVLVSTLDGRYYGMSLFDHIVDVVATHGNARRASSSAFLMSTRREFPASVRADDARPLLRG
jgi:hypothetical protein